MADKRKLLLRFRSLLVLLLRHRLPLLPVRIFHAPLPLQLWTHMGKTEKPDARR